MRVKGNYELAMYQDRGGNWNFQTEKNVLRQMHEFFYFSSKRKWKPPRKEKEKSSTENKYKYKKTTGHP